MIDAWVEASETLDEIYWNKYGKYYLEEFEDCNCDLDEDRVCECPDFDEWLEHYLGGRARLAHE